MFKEKSNINLEEEEIQKMLAESESPFVETKEGHVFNVEEQFIPQRILDAL